MGSLEKIKHKLKLLFDLIWKNKLKLSKIKAIQIGFSLRVFVLRVGERERKDEIKTN